MSIPFLRGCAGCIGGIVLLSDRLLFFEVVEVYPVGVVLIEQAVGYDFASVVADHREEAVVDRGLDEDFVAGCGEGADDSG